MEQRGEETLRKIPLSVDNPVPILFWDPVDFIGGITVFGMGVALNMFFLGLIGCIAVLTVASKLRQGAKRGAAQHWLWYMGLTIDVSLARFKVGAAQNDFIG